MSSSALVVETNGHSKTRVASACGAWDACFSRALAVISIAAFERSRQAYNQLETTVVLVVASNPVAQDGTPRQTSLQFRPLLLNPLPCVLDVTLGRIGLADTQTERQPVIQTSVGQV